jgi:hypothetical protein
MLQQKTRTRAYYRSPDRGERLRTTAVTFSVLVRYVIPKVSSFLRPSPFPTVPLPAWYHTAILVAARTRGVRCWSRGMFATSSVAESATYVHVGCWRSA